MLLRLCRLLLLFGAIPSVSLAYTFVNPASHGGQTSFAQNTVYAEKSILEVQWTEGETDQDATVALFQVDISKTTATDVSPATIGDLEYIAEGQDWNRTSRRWIVITDKDLTVSPVFVMMLFVTGATAASDETVYFNISSTDLTDSTSASTSALTSTSAGATTMASIAASSSVSSPSTSAMASGLTSDSSSALPTSAKLGIGVGIPAAAIAGVLAGWLVFRRRKSYNQQSLGGQPSHGGQSQEEKARGFDGSTVASPRTTSSTFAYRPASNTPVHQPPSVHGPVSGIPVYEAHNEQFAPSELDAPSTMRY